MNVLRPVAMLVMITMTSVCVLCCDEFDSPTAPESAGEAVVLSVPYVGQQTEVWCWAAVSEMVLRYYGRPVAQCQILSSWYRGDCCAFPSLCLTTASIPVIRETMFQFGGVGSAYLPRAMTFAELSSEINAGRPLIIAYRGSFSGHVVVLYGYDPEGFVYLHDPYFGTFRRVPYGQSFSYGGQLFWAETIYGIS